MSSNPLRPRISGFALAEALVALLLLATAMLGAGAALIESLAGQRSALLQTRAADLASDLAEALRSAPDAIAAATEIHTWQSAVLLQLPQSEAIALPRPAASPGPPGNLVPARFDIRLRWRNGGMQTTAQLNLPLAVALPATP